MEAAAAYNGDQLTAIIDELNERYGLDVVSIAQLGGELDGNFMASTAERGPYFVRLTNTETGADVVDWQNRVLQQLAQRPLSVSTPRLLTQHDGAVMSRMMVGETETYLRVTTWLPGVTVADLGETTSTLRHQLGRLAAEAIDSLSPLAEFADRAHSHHWMAVRSGDSLRATMHAVTNPARRALLDTALERFDAIAPSIPHLPETVVHQDLHDFNLLGERLPDGSARISGVVDFNDAVYTARVAELAVAAGYSALRQPDPYAAFLQVVRGYVSCCDLSEAEITALFPLAVARLAVNGSTWTARAGEGNTAYAEARMAATWPALEQLMRVSPPEAADQIHQLHEQRTVVAG